MKTLAIENPYRPGAGHAPPFLAGRLGEQHHLKRLLQQPMITENILITGLRGYGKTVLVDHMRTIAEECNWLWVGNDLSESSSLTEERLALRILTDIAQALESRLQPASLSSLQLRLEQKVGHIPHSQRDMYTFEGLKQTYEQSPGLPSDRLKAVMVRVTDLVQRLKLNGIVLAYDEAQCLSDKAEQSEFPLSMLIETVSSLQKRSGLAPCLLILSGLPQLFDALTSTRTYTERMFHVMALERLSRQDTWNAIVQPIQKLMPPLYAPPALIEKVVSMTGGYPYLIQFFGREVVDQILENGGTLSAEQFPSAASFERLDAGLFSARWNRTTDKQRELLGLIARRPPPLKSDFSAQELEQLYDRHEVSSSSITQMLVALCERGVLYRTRHGQYAFTVPMSEAMILRRLRHDDDIAASWEPTAVPASVAPVFVPAHQAAQAQAERPKRRSWFGAARG
jgi:AAA ATPase domain